METCIVVLGMKKIAIVMSRFDRDWWNLYIHVMKQTYIHVVRRQFIRKKKLEQEDDDEEKEKKTYFFLNLLKVLIDQRKKGNSC